MDWLDLLEVQGTLKSLLQLLRGWNLLQPLYIEVDKDLFTLKINCKGIQPVHPKGNQSWMFIERTDVEAETLILWPPDAKS